MYTKHQLKEYCHNGIVTVVFTKSDGSERTMRATLLPEYVNNGKTLLQENDAETKKRPDNPNVMVVWDVDANGWRSFRIDSIKGVS